MFRDFFNAADMTSRCASLRYFFPESESWPQDEALNVEWLC